MDQAVVREDVEVDRTRAVARARQVAAELTLDGLQGVQERDGGEGCFELDRGVEEGRLVGYVHAGCVVRRVFRVWVGR